MKKPLLPAFVVTVLALLPAMIMLLASSSDMPELGQLSGWLGTGLIAASLLLMVREPAWALWFGGLQRMYRWHHGMGVVGYVLLLMHPLLLTGTALAEEPAIAWRFISPLNQPLANDLGWMALMIFMLGLAATFAIRLPYGIWRYLHMLLAVAMILALAHIWLANGFSISLGLALLPAVVAMAWRLLRADRGMGARPYEVSAMTHPTEQITEIKLRPLAAPLAITPGQFVSAAFFEGPGFSGCGEFHPYTVSQAAADGSLQLMIKALGDCTRHIQELQPGVAVRVQGPYGEFLQNRANMPELWVAAGIGITPFLALLRDRPVTQTTDLVYVHRERDHAAYEQELQSSAARQEYLRFHSLPMSNDPRPLFSWLASVADIRQRQIYLCGPSPLMALVRQWLREHQVPGQHIHFEIFDLR